MIKLSDKKLNEVSGGALTKAAALTIAAIGIFVVGVFDGYFRPLKCNK